MSRLSGSNDSSAACLLNLFSKNTCVWVSAMAPESSHRDRALASIPTRSDANSRHIFFLSSSLLVFPCNYNILDSSLHFSCSWQFWNPVQVLCKEISNVSIWRPSQEWKGGPFSPKGYDGDQQQVGHRFFFVNEHSYLRAAILTMQKSDLWFWLKSYLYSPWKKNELPVQRWLGRERVIDVSQYKCST